MLVPSHFTKLRYVGIFQSQTQDVSLVTHWCFLQSYRVVQELKTSGFALAAGFSGMSGQFLALGSAGEDYGIVRLGPFLGTELVPLNLGGGNLHLPAWAMKEVLYRSGFGPSLVQRYMLEGSQTSLRNAANVLNKYPDTIYTFDRRTGTGCFETALELKKPNLLKMVMTTVVDGTLEAENEHTRTILTSDIPTNARATLQSMVSNQSSDFIVDVLAQMTYIKVPFAAPKQIYKKQAMVRNIVPINRLYALTISPSSSSIRKKAVNHTQILGLSRCLPVSWSDQNMAIRFNWRKCRGRCTGPQLCYHFQILVLGSF